MFPLFFLPFLLIGLALLGMATMKVTQHLQSLSWVSVQANLLDVGESLEQTAAGRDKIGGASRVAGRYSYQWQGQRYESERLSFSSARVRSSSGSGPDDWDERVSEAIGERGSSFPVWVNPKAPDQAVVLRDLRWFELGAMIGFGLLLTWAGAHFMFGLQPHESTPAFSWRAVSIMWIAGLMLAVLCPLLWRDGHPVWAVAAALPLLLAFYGTAHGIRLMLGNR